MLMLNNISILR